MKGINRKPAKSSDAIETVHRRYFARRPDREALLEKERVNAAIGRQIRELREKAGLSQRALAKSVGTTASVICRLEDADYGGHSLSMLNRIAAALNKKIEVRFLPRKRARQHA